MKPYYQDDAVTIYHGDCREILPELPRHDLLLTDPPYGIGASSGTGKYGRIKWTDGDTGWDESTPANAVLACAISQADKSILWGGNYFALPPSRQYLVWDKGAGFQGRDFAECEQAWCSWDANARIYRRDPLAMGDYRGKQHPTQKPIALMRWCLSFAPDATTILDPFAGSGTTGVAAKLEGRKATLIEMEERYCEIAAKRLAQGVLF
jgi:DNA modification methylase